MEVVAEAEAQIAKYAVEVERAKGLGCIRCEKQYARYFDLVVKRNHPHDDIEVMGVICPSCKVTVRNKIDHE